MVEKSTLQPFVHLWSEINTQTVGKIRHRCTSMLIDHYPPMVVWKRWGQTHFMENRCSIICKLSNASQNQVCHLSDSLAIFLKFQCTFGAHLNGWHWLDGGRCRTDFSARSTFSSCESFSENMASEEEKAAWKSPVKFNLPSMFGRIVTPLMSVGFQSIREFHGISMCWDAEDQRESCALLCGQHRQHLTFSEPGGRSCSKKNWGEIWLRSQTLRFLGSDPSFRVLVVVRSSYPSLWYIFSTSQWNKRHTKHETQHQNHRNYQWIGMFLVTTFGPK